MARTSKSRGAAAFKMRSGNSSTFKMMGSSPMRNETDEKFTGESEQYSGERKIDPNSKFDKAYFQDLDDKARANEYLQSDAYKHKVSDGIEKHGSKEAYEASVLETAVDRGKSGGVGASDYGTSVEVDKLKLKNRNKAVSEMSKKELLEASGKKTGVINRLFASKKKLSKKAQVQNVRDYYSTKGSGMGQQALQSGDVSDTDKYSGVTE